jgi:(1->4)-alpha-D-glucan 1-alpha-D-glucosylmutase
VVAFTRAGKVAAVAPLRPTHSLHDWQDSTIPLADGSWHNLLTGERWSDPSLRVDLLLGRFPVALLVRQD